MDLEKTRKWIDKNSYHGIITEVSVRTQINKVTVHEQIKGKRPFNSKTMTIFKSCLECIKINLGREMK